MQKECKTAIFNFQESDKDLIDSLAVYLDSHAEEIYNFFEIDCPKEKVVINIVPTKKEYDDLYRRTRGLSGDFPVAGWMIGNCRDGIITYLSLHDYKNTTHAYKDVEYAKALDYYKKTILHEYVHFINENFNLVHNCNYTEKYLVEGIACYLSKQKENQRTPFNFTCEQLLNKNNNLYGAYYLITKYFVENYDKKYVLEVFQSNRQARELLKNELFDKAQQFYATVSEKEY